MNFSENSLSEVVEFARLKSAGNTKQEKTCSKGWPCGFTCLPRTKKNCNKGLDGQAKTVSDWLEKNTPAKSGLPHQNPKTYKEFIENGRAIAGEEFFKQAKIADKKIEKLEDEERNIRLTAPESPEFLQFAKASDPVYAALRQQYDDLINPDMQVSQIVAIARQRNALSKQFGPMEKQLLERYLEQNPEYQKVKTEYDKLTKPIREFRDRLIQTSSLSDSEAKRIVDGINKLGDDPKFSDNMTEFLKLTNGRSRNSLQNVDFGEDDRAFASKEERLVAVSPGSKSDLFHEAGHHIEFEDDRIASASRAWLESRSTSKTPQRLGDLTGDPLFRDDEVALPDRFINPYVGKVYPTRYTEAVSVGLEHFASAGRMAELAAKDPEHFALVLGMVRR